MNESERYALRVYLRRHGKSEDDIEEVLGQPTTCVLDGICLIGYRQAAVIDFHELMLRVADQVAHRLNADDLAADPGEDYVVALMAREPVKWAEERPSREQATEEERQRHQTFLAAARESQEAYREVTGAPVVWDKSRVKGGGGPQTEGVVG